MSQKQSIKYKLFTKDNPGSTFETIQLQVSNQKGGYIIHRSLVHQMEEKRQGTASTKTRSEVRGGGKKPWKQKGTGKARAGSIRSPLWRGGGVIFGPKTKKYALKINLKEKQLALRNLLANKADDIIVLKEEYLLLKEPKTADAQKVLLSLNINIKNKSLIVVKNKNKNLYLAIRNLPNVDLVQANHLNIHLLINHKNIIITQDALSVIKEVYGA
uniref:Large ribosomal subunit protein uL4c n=1 Tax=Dermonema virens TaxID=1077399 RepID=A0A1G4NRX7_9FLOR|nr:Ribosomal protein L4 [Dermonema virens]SCW21384.1 Ribosomal protein L4 [Dermonema virens]